jgi:hypothetical protein
MLAGLVVRLQSLSFLDSSRHKSDDQLVILVPFIEFSTVDFGNPLFRLHDEFWTTRRHCSLRVMGTLEKELHPPVWGRVTVH